MVGTPPLEDSVRLLREIAAGPRSVVYVGDLDRGTARTLVAVKVFRHRFRRDAPTLFRLRDVGRALLDLREPALIAAPLEVVEVNDRLGLVAAYVDGVDVFDLCEVLWQTDASIPPRVTCGLLGSVAEALHAAQHTVPTGEGEPLGRAHRDLRPTNIMLDRDGQVRILDFGTGLTSFSGRQARNEALKQGVSKYLSPARREGKRGGEASDIYALGVIGIELCRGKWLRRLRARNPDHDRPLAPVVARMTDLGFRTEGDDLALRNLLLRMVAFDAEARPSSADVAHVCRQLEATATGPDLLAFADAKVVPWLEAVPDSPDTDVPDTRARILDSAAEAPPVPDDIIEEAHHADSEADWIETEGGWQAIPKGDLLCDLPREATADEDPVLADAERLGEQASGDEEHTDWVVPSEQVADGPRPELLPQAAISARPQRSWLPTLLVGSGALVALGLAGSGLLLFWWLS